MVSLYTGSLRLVKSTPFCASAALIPLALPNLTLDNLLTNPVPVPKLAMSLRSKHGPAADIALAALPKLPNAPSNPRVAIVDILVIPVPRSLKLVLEIKLVALFNSTLSDMCPWACCKIEPNAA